MSDNVNFNGLDLDENEMAPDLISLVDEEGNEYMFESGDDSVLGCVWRGTGIFAYRIVREYSVSLDCKTA